jgi:hypothetical protein
MPLDSLFDHVPWKHHGARQLVYTCENVRQTRVEQQGKMMSKKEEANPIKDKPCKHKEDGTKGKGAIVRD